LEHSEEHTSELVWLVDSIQLYALEIEKDFTTCIVEFLQGVVAYLAKCPGGAKWRPPMNCYHHGSRLVDILSKS